MTELERESKRFAENIGVPWHEFDYKFTKKIALYEQSSAKEFHFVRCSCGDDVHSQNWKHYLDELNPTYNVELIRAELERVGKWRSFGIWLDQVYWYNLPDDFPENTGLFDILTTPLLLLQAANSFIEQEREDAAYQTGNGG